MKWLQALVAFGIVGLAGGVLYHFIFSDSVHKRVDEVSTRVDKQGEKLEAVRQQAGQRLDDHEGRLKEVEARTEGQQRALGELRSHLDALGGQVKVLEADREANGAEIDKLRREMEQVASRVDALAASNAGYVKELEELRKQLDGRAKRDAGLEARLRDIEKRLGIERPEP
jgi:chromosome segregation ATPase